MLTNWNKKCLGTIVRMYNLNFPDYFIDSWEKMIHFNNEFICDQSSYIHYTKGRVSYHELGRNGAVNEMRGDWLFMVDTDHMFAPDLLDRLLFLRQKYNSQVISGIYQYKVPPHAPVANVWQSPDKDHKGLTGIVNWPKNEPVVNIGAVGGGVLLINREVFDRIKTELNEEPFTKDYGLSEDYAFCYRCKKLDIPIHLAINVQSHHVINCPLDIRDYKYLQNGLSVKVEDGKIIV